MIRSILNIILLFILLFILLIVDTPVYPISFSQKVIENYTLKISSKFSNTYCNTTKFGISKDSALKFAIGETNKSFLNNKLNKFIDYELLKKNILLSIENNCSELDFPSNALKDLAFEY